MTAPFASPSAAFWSGRRVLITGHTGFKGAWLALWLHHLGAVPHGFALPPETQPNAFDLARIGSRMQSTIGDIRDAAALDAAIRACRPDIVLHLAAQPLVRRSYLRPVETFATNVMGTVHVLDSATRSGAAACVVVTTDKCYENREWLWPYRETEALGGHDPYSASKACAELAAQCWRRSQPSFAGQGGAPSMAIATARAGNVIGGGDWAGDRLIPDCVRAIAAGQDILIRSPAAVRPWQHVLEPLAGYLLLAERLVNQRALAEDAWNFGPAMEEIAPVSHVVDAFVQGWGGTARWRVDAAPKPHEATLLAVDATRARMMLGWRPRLSLGETIAWTVDWYRRQAAGMDAGVLMQAQIESYEAIGQANP